MFSIKKHIKRKVKNQITAVDVKGIVLIEYFIKSKMSEIKNDRIKIIKIKINKIIL
jgi:hypothetical protein